MPIAKDLHGYGELMVWRRCQACGLCKTRRHVVLGRGFLPADILMVGEAPGKSEDLLQRAFVGPAGRLLKRAVTDALALLGVSNGPRPTYYVTNVLGCRPTDSQGGPNRVPREEEAWACRPRLMLTYHLASPKAVVFLGKTAERYCKRAWPEGFPLVHPAFVLRSGGYGTPRYRQFIQDLAEVYRRVMECQ